MWKFVVSCAVFAVTATACDAQQPLSRTGFRDAVASAISSRRPDLCVQARDDATLDIGRSEADCDEVQVSTAYVYSRYASDPTHQDLYVGQLVATTLSGVTSLEEGPFTPDRNLIVAVLRPDAYAVDAGAAGDPTSSIFRPFAGDFVAMLSQVDKTQTRSLRGVDLERAGLTESQAWELAITNLRQRIGEVTRTPNQAGAEVVTAASGLAPASLLFPETCASTGSDFDVFIVARDTFFYADTHTPGASESLASYAAQLIQSGDDVYSHRLLSCLDGRWYSSVFDGSRAWLPEQHN